MVIPEERKYRKIMFEVALIVLGVWLALLANSWQDKQRKQAKATLALKSIRVEMAGNLEKLKGEIDEHERRIADFENFSRSEDFQDFAGVLANAGGFSFPYLTAATWDSALAIGATEPMSLEVTRAVTRVRESLATLKSREQRSIDLIYNTHIFKTEETRALIHVSYMMMRDLVEHEKQLIKQLEELLRIIDKELKRG